MFSSRRTGLKCLKRFVYESLVPYFIAHLREARMSGGYLFRNAFPSLVAEKVNYDLHATVTSRLLLRTCDCCC